MKTFVAFVTLCLAVASAQFSKGYSPYRPYGPYGPYGPYYGDRSCPVSLLWELSSIVQTLYGYGQDPYNPYQTGNLFGGSSFAQGFSGLSASGRGFQATSPLAGNYNPTCPWPLINGLISQIQQYVNQLRSAATGTGTGTNPYPFPFADDGLPIGPGGAFVSPFGPFRGGVKK